MLTMARMAFGLTLSVHLAVPDCHSPGSPGNCEGIEPVEPTRLPDPGDVPFAVYFFDVDTGDAILVDYGDVEIVVDTGKGGSTMRDRLHASGLVEDGTIELVILTHADPDHYGGLGTMLLGRYPFHVGEFWEPGYDRGTAFSSPHKYADLMADLAAHLPARRFKRPLQCYHQPIVGMAEDERAGADDDDLGVAFAVGDRLRLRLLHSDMAPETERDSPGVLGISSTEAYRINNASIVTRLEFDGAYFLLTGDINGRPDDEDCQSSEVEGRLLEEAAEYLQADVLKVPHHGSDSANTPEFVSAVSPRFAVVSDHEHDRSGLGPPDQHILDYYRGAAQCEQFAPEDLELFELGDRMRPHVRCTVEDGAPHCEPFRF